MKSIIEILKDLYGSSNVGRLTREEIRSALLAYQKQYVPSIQDIDPNKTFLDVFTYAFKDLYDQGIVDFQESINIHTAKGDFLDWIGALYGLKRRNNESDDEYRQRLKELQVGYPVEQFIISDLLAIPGVSSARVVDDSLVSVKDGTLHIFGYGEFEIPDISGLADILNMSTVAFSLSVDDEKESGKTMQAVGEVLRSSYPNSPLLTGNKTIPLLDSLGLYQSSIRVYIDNQLPMEIRISKDGELIKIAESSKAQILKYANEVFSNFKKITNITQSNVESLIPSWVPELQSQEFQVSLRRVGEDEDLSYPVVFMVNDIPGFQAVNEV